MDFHGVTAGIMKNGYSWKDFEEIFEVDLNRSTGLADPIDEQYNIVFEYTINLPPRCFKNMELVEKVSIYRAIHEELKREFRAIGGEHTIEYCRNREPHIHGHIEVPLHPNTYLLDDRLILDMIAKHIYLQLPRSLYKQFSSMKYDAHIRRLKGPAVCLNMKNCLEKGWVDYINKSQ